MNEMFRFQLKTELYCGIGWSRNLDKFLSDRGFKRVLLLVDEGCARHSTYFNEILEIIKHGELELEVEFLRGSEEPDYDYLDQVSDKARGKGDIDVLVGIGGGSCLDITKAVAVLLTNPGKGIEYRGFDKVIHPGVPTICIPTTAGTGSEVTINAVFTDKKEMKKLGINGRHMNATYSVLDAEWTISCPHSVSLSSGMDAMTHALESFSCNQHNALTRVYSKEAFKILFQNLPTIITAPEDRKKRQKLLLGSHLAAIALFNSGSGIAGALSYPLGVHFKVPHGIGGAIFLSSVISYNVDNGYSDYSELYDLVTVCDSLSTKEKSKAFDEMFQNFSEEMKVPKYLNEWGINTENADKVCSLMHPMQGAFDQNPVPFNALDDARRMIIEHVRR